MLLTKHQRRKQMRPISLTIQHQLKQQAHKYRLQQYAELLRLGVFDLLADEVFDIWENGCQSTRDRAVLDRLNSFLEKRTQPKALECHPIPKTCHAMVASQTVEDIAA